MITLFKIKYNEAYRDSIYEKLPNKHIPLPTGFTLDHFWYNIGSCESTKMICSWHHILEYYLTDAVRNIVGLLIRNYVNLTERCPWLAE